MRKLLNVFSISASVMFCLVITTIILCSLLADGGEYSINQSPSLIATIILAALLMVGSLLIYTKINKKKTKLTPKKEALLVGGILLCIMIIQLILGYFLSVVYTWDPNELYQAMLPIFDGEGLGNTEYVSHYPFQLMLINLSVALIGVFKFLGIGLSIHTVWLLMNIVCITVSFLLIYLILRKLLGVRSAIFGLLLAVIFTPILLYVPITYTDTVSMPFVLLAFYLFLLMIDTSKTTLRKRLIIAGLFAVTIFFGFNIKATVGILLVAILIYCLLTFNKKYLKLFSAYTGIFVIVFVPLTLLYSWEQSRLLDDTLIVPKTHWVMMGLNDGEFTGGWNRSDWDMTYRAMGDGATSQELQSMHLEEIKNRLSDYGFGGYVGFTAKKIAYTWGDGTYTVSDQLNKLPVRPDSLAFQVFAKDGQYNNIYIIFAHAVQVYMLVVLLWGGCVSIKKKNVTLVLKLVVIGVFLFFMVWETTSRYLLNYLPLFVVLTVYMTHYITQGRHFMIKWRQNGITKSLEPEK